MIINTFETLALLILFLIFGYYLNNKFKFLRNNYVPAPVIGGLIFSILLSFINRYVDVSLDYGDIGPVAMGLFIGSIGFRFTYDIFKNTIKKTLMYFSVVIFIVFIQNAISFSLGYIFKKDILESAILGSVGFMGDFSITSKLTEFIMATPYRQLFIDVSNLSLYLGVIGVIITFKFFLKPRVDLSQSKKVPPVALSPKRFLNYIGIMIFITGVGLIPYFLNDSKIFTTAGGPLIVGMLTRWAVDKFMDSRDVDNWIVNFIGNFALSVLLISVFSKSNPFLILSLDIYAVIVALIQVAWLIAFAVFFVFKIYNEDTLAAYIAAGTVGFSIGIPPSTMSVIQNITEVEGAQPYFLFIVPPGAAWLITIVNPLEILIFLKIFS